MLLAFCNADSELSGPEMTRKLLSFCH